jgi:hypothetical protein
MPMTFQRQGLLGLALAGAALLAACTQQPSSNSSGMSGGNMQGMQDMNMEQMMQHCREMQGMDRSQMTPDMQRMVQQCDKMMEMHGGS